MVMIHTSSPEETLHLGQLLAALLKAGDVVCLCGDLGAGKTLLTKGIAAGLGVTEDVTSPTFTVLQVYEAKPPIYHFDLYRLEHADELMDIGFDEFVSGSGIAIIEWADKFSDFMPEEYLRIEIMHGATPETRTIQVQPQGNRYESLVEELKKIAGSCFRNVNTGF